MRRSVLGSLAALGVVVCGLGGTGLFAALTDTARGGPNSVESAPLAGSADIQLADASFREARERRSDYGVRQLL